MVRVLIIEPSAVARKLLAEEMGRKDGIEVAGSVVSTEAARGRMLRLRPDVVVLDLDGPEREGLEFLQWLTGKVGMPVVVLASRCARDSLRDLPELEAVTVISKPESAGEIGKVAGELTRALRMAVSLRRSTRHEECLAEPPASGPATRSVRRILAIGASTGGTKAIETVLAGLPATAPPTLIVQHMPEAFTSSFAERLDRLCALRVREARDGDPLESGLALVAPGNFHLLLEERGGAHAVRLSSGPPVHHQRPSVDVLFESVAACAGRCAIGVLLTGMGADGARGLLSLRERGAFTIAQDEESCVVYGMPKEAVKLGAATKVLALALIPRAILSAVERNGEML